MTERYGLCIDNTSFFNSKREVKGIVDNRTGYKYIGFENVLNLVNQSTDELMDLRAENTKLKFVLKDVIEDLEKQAETKEPIIISKKYVKWIKKESGLHSISGDLGMTEKRFTLGVCEEGLGIYDNQTKEQYLELADDHLIRICAVLNELHEETLILKRRMESKQKVIDAYDNYIKTLKEDGVLE